MHIEPGVVGAAKIGLSYATGAASFGILGKLSLDTIKSSNVGAFVLRSAIASALVFSFFEILPHHAVGVSEVHLILGTTLFLLFGAGPAAVGLALGLLVQGLFFAPFDLPQYGMNVTTLLVPLAAMSVIARKIIPANTAYKDVGYGQALKLSVAYQGGIVAWVAFWALYGQGFGAENISNVLSFGAAYMSVIIIEPLIDLAVLAAAKSWSRVESSGLFQTRLFRTA